MGSAGERRKVGAVLPKLSHDGEVWALLLPTCGGGGLAA